MHLIALTQHVCIGGLGAVGRTEHIHRCACKQRVAVYVITGSGRYVILHKCTLQCSLGSSLACGGLGNVLGGGHYCSATCCGSRGGDIGRILLSLHLVEDGQHPVLVVGVFSRGNVIDVNTLLHESGTYLSLVKSTFLQLSLSH